MRNLCSPQRVIAPSDEPEHWFFAPGRFLSQNSGYPLNSRRTCLLRCSGHHAKDAVIPAQKVIHAKGRLHIERMKKQKARLSRAFYRDMLKCRLVANIRSAIYRDKSFVTPCLWLSA